MKLIYFTNSYPYGLGEEWKKNELITFAKYFASVVVVPFSYSGNKDACEYLEGISYSKPIFENSEPIKLKHIDLFKIILSPSFKVFLKEFFDNKVYLSKVKLIQWGTACLKMDAIKSSEIFKRYANCADNDTVFYYFWGRDTSEVVPVLEKKYFHVIKLHGYDLYTENCTSNYIPFQKRQLELCDLILTISDFGKDYLTNKFPQFSKKIRVSKLGVNNMNLGNISKNSVLRIVSCSFLVKLKRIDLLIQALMLCKGFAIEWTHIGDGPEMDNLKQLATQLPSNVVPNFIGKVNPNEVIPIYLKNSFDLFINVSSTEGIPVSIMEAISVGLPIYATNVGGVKEIVCSANGKLLEPNISPTELATEFFIFYNIPFHKKIELRKSSIQKYMLNFNADKNNIELAHLIKTYKNVWNNSHNF